MLISRRSILFGLFVAPIVARFRNTEQEYWYVWWDDHDRVTTDYATPGVAIARAPKNCGMARFDSYSEMGDWFCRLNGGRAS